MEVATNASGTPVAQVDAPVDKPVTAQAIDSAASKVDKLRQEALRIAEMSLKPAATEPQSQVDNAKKKIAVAVGMVRENYDYETPWLEIAAYRKSVGDFEGAIAAWKFLLKLRPQSYVPAHNLGDLYAFTLKDYKTGEDYLLKSVDFNQQNVQGYLALSQLYSVKEFGKEGQAEFILLKGIQANPKEPLLRTVLAGIYRDKGFIAEAIKLLEESLVINPSNTDVQRELDELKAKQTQ